MDANPAACPIDLVEADICHVEIDHASMVALNYTLQFVAVSRRRALLDSIYRGLQPGGLLVLSEKICLDDPGGEGDGSKSVRLVSRPMVVEQVVNDV